jgi:hypothetical protein
VRAARRCTSLFVSTRASAELEVFDVSDPLAPKRSSSLKLKDTPQAGFADDAGLLVTFLGNDVPLVEVSRTDDGWQQRDIAGLGGSDCPVRVAGTLFRATGESRNALGLFEPDGVERTATKLGPTSLQLCTDGRSVVTLGDALSVWTAEGELVAKKKGVEGTFITAGAGFVLVPQRPDARARKHEAFAFDVWALRELEVTPPVLTWRAAPLLHVQSKHVSDQAFGGGHCACSFARRASCLVARRRCPPRQL